MSFTQLILSYLLCGGAVGLSFFFAMKDKIQDYLKRYGPGPVYGIFAIAIIFYPIALTVIGLILWGEKVERAAIKAAKAETTNQDPS